MYTGTLINDLLAAVEKAECHSAGRPQGLSVQSCSLYSELPARQVEVNDGNGDSSPTLNSLDPRQVTFTTSAMAVSYPHSGHQSAPFGGIHVFV
jgi:hypothetical protein